MITKHTHGQIVEILDFAMQSGPLRDLKNKVDKLEAELTKFEGRFPWYKNEKIEIEEDIDDLLAKDRLQKLADVLFEITMHMRRCPSRYQKMRRDEFICFISDRLDVKGFPTEEPTDDSWGILK